MVEPVFCLGVVLLAAGRSTRMGRPKLLLPWGGSTVLGHLLAQWRGLGAAQVVVVHAAQDRPILAELDRLAVPQGDRVINPQPDRGMFSSIICAAQYPGWLPSVTQWAIVLGDQPHLKQDTLVRLVGFAKQHADQVCQPTRSGTRRHPVVLPRKMFLGLARSGATSFREFLLSFEIAGLACDDPGLELDIDHPEDYQKALALAGLAPSSDGFVKLQSL